MTQSKNAEANESGPLGEICAHIESIYGESEIVMHEILSDELHIDVFPIPPSEEWACWTLYTTGMSEAPMNVPREEGDDEDEVRGMQYAEMVIQLPPDWPVLDKKSGDREEHYWPIRWLKRAARLPNEEDSWLGMGHTVQFSEPEEEINSGGFAGMLLMPPMGPDEWGQIKMSDGRTVNVLMILPLYRDELDFAVEEGVEALLEKFEEAALSPVVEVGRKSVLES